MRDKGKMRGTFRVYLQWPLLLSVLLIVLTAVVGTVSAKAGIIVSVFTLVYIGIALWLYFTRKRGILGGLIAFSQAYDQSRQTLLKEMLIPYAVSDGNGRILWMNQEFEKILEEDKNGLKNGNLSGNYKGNACDRRPDRYSSQCVRRQEIPD